MPQELLTFTPAYCVVGLYRLITDPNIRNPVWDKCRHGVLRGAIVGAAWTFFTWPVQRAYVEYFLLSTPRFATLSTPTLLGLSLPLNIRPLTWATLLVVSTQFDWILYFFLSKNLRIARARAYDLTIKSRAKPDEFWGAYAEEFLEPPSVQPTSWNFSNIVSSSIARIILRQAIVLPLVAISPIVALLVSAAIKSLGMSKALHAPYFVAKKMTPRQVAVFMEERKWDYRAFGFFAALLETTPFVGILLSISNRIGAAMWAFDLEKRQEMFRKGELKPVERPTEVEGERSVGGGGGDVVAENAGAPRVVGEWK